MYRENKEIFNEITKKKEFSQLPEKDVEIAYKRFERREVSEQEKIRLTRELLHKVYSSFTSQKLLSPKNKTAEWVLRKHLSTRERLPFYSEIYPRLLKNFAKEVSVIDLGAGVNGFSYEYMKNPHRKVSYFGIEGVGQLVDLSSSYFKKENLPAKAIHMSLFDLDELKEIISKTNEPRVVFLFKAIDSIEMLEKDYSLKLIKEVAPFVDEIVVSFAVESMISRKKFKVSRGWLTSFLEKNFKIGDDFEIGGERYICFSEK